MADSTSARNEKMLEEKKAQLKSLEQAPVGVSVIQQEPRDGTAPAGITDSLYEADDENDAPVGYSGGIYPNNSTRLQQKRRSMDSDYPTPCEGAFVSQPQSTLPKKKRKLLTSQPAPEEHEDTCSNTSLGEDESDTETLLSSISEKYEFHFDSWTDFDSDSAVSLARYDWCLSVVRTRLFTNPSDAAEYWTWKSDDNIFQHRVLKGGKWCLLQDEINFHVRTADIVEIQWNIKALCVHIIMRKDVVDPSADGKPRRDVIASFPRQCTIRRFPFFCKERGMKMVNKSGKYSLCDETVACQQLTDASKELNKMWGSIVF
ncbi:hypothetical protein AU210_016371 [Fusarium oxysporum f. sp. radicis-cucumerinum]|uniref:Uncharacterized protein n=1 Tax=Fusarium oxysporum f. sp. radicis-cucumerinum TaxID=327505 RepID=A0A2H3FRQ1_FUSOX|nr:hypothetical protein AU210_016371 [Fusarium oxysporum f. sp. radicis-cucumerinum]